MSRLQYCVWLSLSHHPLKILLAKPWGVADKRIHRLSLLILQYHFTIIKVHIEQLLFCVEHLLSVFSYY